MTDWRNTPEYGREYERERELGDYDKGLARIILIGLAVALVVCAIAAIL